MKYVSTRGIASPVGWETAICAGYASDGGLYVPDVIPTVTTETLTQVRDLCVSL